MIEVAERIANVQEYYFSRKLEEIRLMVANGHDVINLGIGSPDLPPAPAVIETMVASALKKDSHAYQSYKSIPELRGAIAAFYQKQYGVKLDPTEQILPLLGSKEGVMYISMAFLNAGDTVLVPNPGYPAYRTAADMMGARTVFFNLTEENDWLPDFDAIDPEDLKKAKLMWVNYPNMPTGKQASTALFQQLADFAVQHNILVVNDNPYSFILNENPLSLFSAKNSMDNCLELNSMSKAFNMAGWRIGMVSGRKEYINAILRVKSNVDSGMFRPLQEAAVTALALEKDWFDGINQEYAKRRHLAEDILRAVGCTFDPKQTGMFVWAKINKGVQSERFVDQILQESHVFITPGTIFGSNGEGYVRISLCSKQSVLKAALKRLEKVTA